MKERESDSIENSPNNHNDNIDLIKNPFQDLSDEKNISNNNIIKENISVERKISVIEDENKIIEKDDNEEDNIENINIDKIMQEEKNKEDNEQNDIDIIENSENNIENYQDEYNEEDLTSCRLTARNNNQDYLEPNDKQDEEEEDEDEDLFPFRIIGDVTKKGETLGMFNNRYLEIDSVKGLFKRYKSSKDYPKNPMETIDIRNFKIIKKVKRIKDYSDIDITYYTKKDKEKTDIYRIRHLDCRNKWYDNLMLLFKHFIKGEPIPKITKKYLLFIDDRMRIIEEMGKKKDKKKKDAKNFPKIKNPEIGLKKFTILGILGGGGFGTVYKVKHLLTDKIYAMKVMNKNYLISKKYLHYVVSEFEIMKALSGSPFILNLHYCFQTANYLYLIIDYCPNGDFTKLEKINNLKLFFAEIILAFENMHNKNIIYRDLKPENILLDGDGHICVCDFNLAKNGMTKHKKTNSFCGSPLYFCPEMILGKGVNYKCDIYDIGLLIYELAVGGPAFRAKNVKSLYEQIKKNNIDFDYPELKADLKDLLKKMVKKNPDERPEFEEIKNHRYFKDIDFNKVLRREYGKIETYKKHKDNDKKGEDKINEKIKENIDYKKFKAEQHLLDEDTDSSFLDGKITVKEMVLDEKRAMKNYVRGFYYIKKGDDLAKDYKLDMKEKVDISSLIQDNYNFEK